MTLPLAEGRRNDLCFISQVDTQAAEGFAGYRFCICEFISNLKILKVELCMS